MNTEIIIAIAGLSVLLGRYMIINIKRLRSYNVFPESSFFIMFLGVFILYEIIKSIHSILINADHSIRAYFQIVIYTITIWIYLRRDIKQTTVGIENIYKSELEPILDSVFKKNNLVLVKEETYNDQTIFSFADPYIKSRLIIKTSVFSTKRHTLIIEKKSDLPYIKAILDEIDSKISPISKKSILIKFTIIFFIIAYITWKLSRLFQ